jgi:hypothetical protein
MRNKIVQAFVICVAAQLAVAAVPAHTEITIIRDKFTVEARQYRLFTFVSQKDSAEVKGRFEAQGGSGNDIEVFLLDRDGLTNWKNHHQANTFYKSGRVTVANIYAKVPRGEYYLIFSNTFSLASNKVVTADLRLE